MFIDHADFSAPREGGRETEGGEKGEKRKREKSRMHT